MLNHRQQADSDSTTQKNPSQIELAKKNRAKKRVAIYARVSVVNESELSIPSQIREAKAYCRRISDQVVKIYQDEGLSGRLTDRPGLQELLADARAGKFDYIIVYDLSRFYRKLDLLLLTMKHLRDWNIGFVSLTENMDFTAKWGKLVLNILGSLAEIYVEGVSESTSRSLHERARRGDLLGSIPTGYCKGLCTNCIDPNGPDYCPLFGQAPIGDGKVLVPHPLESQAVRLAFEWYATGEFSYADIAHKLNQHPVEFNGHTYHLRHKPRRKPKLDDQGQPKSPIIFTNEIVRDILGRFSYTGVIEYRSGIGVAEERKKFYKPQATYQGNHPALIGAELYDRVQAVRRRRRYTPHSSSNANKRVYPLSRILYSWAKRSKMRGTANGSGQRQYRDSYNIGRSKLDASLRSPQPTVDAEPLERQVIDVLETLTLPEDWRQRILAYLVSEEGGMLDVQRKRRDLHARFDRLQNLYIDGDLPPDKFEQEKATIKESLATLLTPVDLDNDEVHELLDNWAELWSLATPGELKNIIACVFQRIYVDQTDIARLIAHPTFLDRLNDPQQRVVAHDDVGLDLELSNS